MTQRQRPCAKDGADLALPGYLARVRELLQEQARAVAETLGAPDVVEHLMPGKLLRSRFAARVGAVTDAAPEDLARACAAIELTHTASLCHDDVIDNALVRRSLPTLWRQSTPSAAVLIGDVLLCNAMALITECAGGRYLKLFLSKVTEVCTTEARQELRLRGLRVNRGVCLDVARGKTGPLFAFLGAVAGGSAGSLAAALEETGYRIGTAYQLADDLLDVSGRDAAAGKTLGTDLKRGKFTLPLSGRRGAETTAAQVRELLESALEPVSPWPAIRGAVSAYIEGDLAPAVEHQSGQPDLALAVGMAP